MTNLRSRRPRLSRRDLVLTRRSFKRALADAFFKLCGFLYYLFYPANNAIEVSRVAFASEKTPTAFDGCVLIQISDLHGKVFRNDSQRLFQLVEREKPDLILITGDLVDERNFDLQEAARVVARANAIAPVLFANDRRRPRGRRDDSAGSRRDARAKERRDRRRNAPRRNKLRRTRRFDRSLRPRPLTHARPRRAPPCARFRHDPTRKVDDPRVSPPRSVRSVR